MYGLMRGRWKRDYGPPSTGTQGETLDTDKGGACGSPRQRSTLQMRNVLACFPKRLHEEAKGYLREMYYATTKDKALELMDRFSVIYGKEYPRAVECLLKDRQSLLTYYSYPQQHWVSLKTSNPIESIFSPVKLRTNAARRIKSPRSALFLIFQLIQRAQSRWRRINAPDMVEKVLYGVKFEEGQEVKVTKKSSRKDAA